MPAIMAALQAGCSPQQLHSLVDEAAASIAPPPPAIQDQVPSAEPDGYAPPDRLPLPAQSLEQEGIGGLQQQPGLSPSQRSDAAVVQPVVAASPGLDAPISSAAAIGAEQEPMPEMAHTEGEIAAPTDEPLQEMGSRGHIAEQLALAEQGQVPAVADSEIAQRQPEANLEGPVLARTEAVSRGAASRGETPERGWRSAEVAPTNEPAGRNAKDQGSPPARDASASSGSQNLAEQPLQHTASGQRGFSSAALSNGDALGSEEANLRESTPGKLKFKIKFSGLSRQQP